MTTEERVRRLEREVRWTRVRAVASFLFVTSVAFAVLSCAGEQANRPPVVADPVGPASRQDDLLRMDWLSLHEYGVDDTDYDHGRLAAFDAVISSMEQQAETFLIPRQKLGLEGIDAEKDLLPHSPR